MRPNFFLSIISSMIVLFLLFYFVLPIFLIFLAVGIIYLVFSFLWFLVTGRKPNIKVVKVKTYSNYQPYKKDSSNHNSLDQDIIETTTADKDSTKNK
ncbi:MAG: hypothetical protein ACRCTJ_03205 [Brevinema sp.]